MKRIVASGLWHLEEGYEDEEFNVAARLPIVTQLTDEELKNPIIKAVQSTMTFEAESKLARENMREFQGTIGKEKAHRLPMFMLPDRRAEFKAEFKAAEAGFY